MKMVEKFSKQVETTVGKGEIAHYEQFLFPLVLSKTSTETCKTKGLFGKGLTLYQMTKL